MGRDRAAGKAKRSAGSGSDAERTTAGDEPEMRSAGAFLHSGRYRDMVSGRAARRITIDRKATMTESRSPRFIQSAIADAGPAAARAALLAPPAEHRAEVLLRRARLAAVRGDHRAGRVLPDAHRGGDLRRPRRRDARGLRHRRTVLVDLGAGNCAKAARLFPLLRAEALRRGRHLGRVPARGAAPGAARASAARHASGSARTSPPASSCPPSCSKAARRSSSIPARASATSPATRRYAFLRRMREPAPAAAAS